MINAAMPPRQASPTPAFMGSLPGSLRAEDGSNPCNHTQHTRAQRQTRTQMHREDRYSSARGACQRKTRSTQNENPTTRNALTMGFRYSGKCL